ncbi:cytochrome c oxidase assembly protein [Microbacterium sp. STN6]|uniref:cytochrome c oxidase assembly protein n=1 Tax=Microbacterium sp. STN6 TaxID=2995588 RepID=UPI002260932C|nr:cytochrome c oxidase assembly protein [Microbacterium sp. STN6]MCX7523070.1 cytochrome c oxidase assembly protein [Microbacterium sp. STN6]
MLTTWRLDPVALVAIILAAGLYTAGVVAARRAGVRWGALRILAFFALGLGSYAWISFGFLGAWSHDLRWAFTTRVALLLFVVPSLIVLGKPVTLARAALSGLPLRTLDRVLNSWPVRLMGNAVFAPLFALSAFLLFLTPVAYVLRDNLWSEWTITLLVPLLGLLMVLPIIEQSMMRTSFFITIEFMLAFVELIMDAIPAILLRLNTHVLDHAPALVGAFPGWFPNPLRDQQLSGDLLWLIAEVTDVPVLIILLMRWMRTDRHEAKAMDDLSDEQMDALMQQHLRRMNMVQAASASEDSEADDATS